MGRSDPSPVRNVLLALAGTSQPCDAAMVSRLGDEDWRALDKLAANHRMQPLLHSLHAANDAVPGPIRAGWKEAHRFAALNAMSQKADMLEVAAILSVSGIEPLVMKGGWLAWHAYPQPALRPLRDVDMLVPEDRFVEAVELLLARGFPFVEAPVYSLADIVRFDKSPPPVVATRGTCIELHLHAWFPEGRLEYPSPPPDDAGLFARSVVGSDGLRYPSPEDMLAHLCIHAVYGHRLDCGPLLLSDIDFLLRDRPIDWVAFWARGSEQGWREGARLVLELVRRWREVPDVSVSTDPGGAPPAEIVEAASDLMLQDLATRSSATFAASALAGGPSALLRRMRARQASASGEDVRRDLSADGGYLGWAWSRLRRTVGELLDPQVRRQSRDVASFTRWLSGGKP